MYDRHRLVTTRRVMAIVLVVWTFSSAVPGLLAAQAGPEVTTVLQRLGIPATTLDGVQPAAVEMACQSAQRGSNCDVNFATLSDQTCRAVAVDVALRRRAEQIRDGGSAHVVMHVRCGRGVFAVFQTSARRAILGHRDAEGNTGHREIPL